MPARLGGLAFAFVNGLVKLYDKKYGTFGEERVRALQADLKSMASEVDALHAENEKLTAELKEAKIREKILLGDLENCKKKVDLLNYLRVEKQPVEENPY